MVVMNIRKGQALQFNFILEKGGFSYHPDGTFSVDYTKVHIYFAWVGKHCSIKVLVKQCEICWCRWCCAGEAMRGRFEQVNINNRSERRQSRGRSFASEICRSHASIATVLRCFAGCASARGHISYFQIVGRYKTVTSMTFFFVRIGIYSLKVKSQLIRKSNASWNEVFIKLQ